MGVRLFLERWRKEYGKSLRHWFITELGHQGTEHIHLHGIIWTDESLDQVEKIWKYGWVWKGKNVRGRIVNYVSGRTASYITKYVTKMDKIHKTYKPKILCSAGIGKGYVNSMQFKNNKYNNNKTNEAYRTSTGHEIALPIYFRNKRYSEHEREQLW